MLISKGHAVQGRRLPLPIQLCSRIMNLAFLQEVRLDMRSADVRFRGEVTELVPVPAFKAVVAMREHSEVSSILMLSRQK